RPVGELPARGCRRAALHEVRRREDGVVEGRVAGALVEDQPHLLAVGIGCRARAEGEITLRLPRGEGPGRRRLELRSSDEGRQDVPDEVLAPEDRDAHVAVVVAGVVGVGVPVVTLLVTFLDRVPAAALAGGALARIVAGGAAAR